jgi:protein O-mannosyl-transferase
MKNRKPESKKEAGAGRAEGPGWILWAAAAGAVVLAWWVWSAALHGPFLFDDMVLPFARPDARAGFTAWSGWVRPVTMFTYWVSMQFSGADPSAYHAMSILLHFATAALVFFIVRRLLEWSGAPMERRGLLAAFAAAVFLLHPAQAESVAYLAGRAEVVSVLFAFAAFAVFLYRRTAAVTWQVSLAVLALFLLALLSKEQTIALPALLLLTDYWWNPGFIFKGIRQNWKLYTPMALGALVAVARFWKLIFGSTTAGFALKDFTWYQYLFTQFRAIFVYIGMFVLPVHLTADWDFPISKTIVDRGAIVGLILLAALAAAAWIYRRRFPLASYGFFAYLVLMAPTSSILPIQDPVAERRLYFGMLGLLLVAVDLLGRVNIDRRALAAACAAVTIMAAVGARARAEVWSDPVLLWKDTVEKSPNKVRGYLHLAQSYYDVGEYGAAVAAYDKAAQIKQPDYDLLIDWGLALDQANRAEEALAKMKQAAALEPTAHVYSQIGMVYAKQRRFTEAMEALNMAAKLDPNFGATYNYRAKIHFSQNEYCPAIVDYRRALALNPFLTDAQTELARAEALARTAGGC